ncbi:unnamed protein product [Citrullus colocynthis]|uniref:Uncharacterized protein n=1 Tax=Citrullus colocynthis TaxID=252529 RepID=A0ABP0YE09_9ROSI
MSDWRTKFSAKVIVTFIQKTLSRNPDSGPCPLCNKSDEPYWRQRRCSLNRLYNSPRSAPRSEAQQF